MTRDQALLDFLIDQRNKANDALASTFADLQVARARIVELEARVKELEPKE